MKSVRFEPEADDEIEAALAASTARGPRKAAKFRAAIVDALAVIASNPLLGSRYGRTEFREWIVGRYPYNLVYVDEALEIRIVAFAHHKRRPGYWKNRLSP